MTSTRLHGGLCALLLLGSAACARPWEAQALSFRQPAASVSALRPARSRFALPPVDPGAKLHASRIDVQLTDARNEPIAASTLPALARAGASRSAVEIHPDSAARATARLASLVGGAGSELHVEGRVGELEVLENDDKDLRLISASVDWVLRDASGRTLHAARTQGGFELEGAPHDRAELDELHVAVGSAQAPIDATVTVTAQASDYRLTVALSDETRELRDTNCRALLEAAAVMIALAVRPPSEAPQVPEIAPHVESIAVRDDALPVPTDGKRRLSLQGWLELGGSYGMLPGLGAALGAGALIGAGRTGLELQTHYLFPSETKGEPAVRVQGVQTALLLRVTPLARLALGLGGAATFLHGRGTHVDQVKSAWIVPGSALLEARVIAVERRRNQLGIASGAGLALVRPHFRVGRHGSVHQPHAWQASLGLFWASDFF
jgi:hypothetical protein